MVIMAIAKKRWSHDSVVDKIDKNIERETKRDHCARFDERVVIKPTHNFIHKNEYNKLQAICYYYFRKTLMKRDILYSPLSAKRTKIMLLGAGELGKEVIIEAMRLGFFPIAVDRYEGAPGQQVAHRAYTGNLKDAGFLRSVIEKEKPDYIVPEIEAINLDGLFDLEKEGYNIIPNARATYTAMQRERIRELIVKTGVPVSQYYYANSLAELKKACRKAGFPCWVKAIQDSSGSGSSRVKTEKDIKPAYEKAKSEARGSAEKLIVEKNIDFDLEVTELVVRY